MSFIQRSTSSPFNNGGRLKRKRLTITTINRFASFNENKSSSAENRRRTFHLPSNLIELLEEDEDDIDDNRGVCHECTTCSKQFASEYGVNHHINMYHPNHSVLCSHCHITFRSHRSLKTHQQRRHPPTQSKLKPKLNVSLPNYSYISSYLVSAFSSKQFPLMAKNACEQQRLPLGSLSSKLFPCHLCTISFPCARTLKCHLLNKHEQYEYKDCEKTLSDIISQVEFDLRTVHDNNDNDIELAKLNLAKQASCFGLISKQLSEKFYSIKREQNTLIFPKCQHQNRTCANLCLKYLSSYSQLIDTYSYTIPIIPKGNPFSQGSIVSIVSSLNNIYSNDSLSASDSNVTNDLSNGRQKRKSNKHADISSSLSPVKKKSHSNLIITNSKSNRNNSNNKLTVKQQTEQPIKTNDTKANATENSSPSATVSPTSGLTRKILPKDNYMRSSSLFNNSSTSTRSSATKSSSSTNLNQKQASTSKRSSKRSLSPPTAASSDNSSKKRQQKPNRKSSSSRKVIKPDEDDDDGNDIEQENGDDESDDNDNDSDDDDDDDDVIPIEVEKPKQQRHSRQRNHSSSSIEYVQTSDNNQQSTSSLNNIENLKSKSKIHGEDIIICRSPPSLRRNTSSNKNSKASINGHGTRKSGTHQSPTNNNNEHIRVRCKICGEILEGRSRFSQHVINMHSHLLKKNVTESKHRATVVR